ncbi:MAG: hypothetical protein E5Y10_24460 [Mesorhizobium sp.]|nr:MAG: hypothetical protein E5Y10_24460 [Mesorhizobium sp.]
MNSPLTTEDWIEISRNRALWAEAWYRYVENRLGTDEADRIAAVIYGADDIGDHFGRVVKEVIA